MAVIYTIKNIKNGKQYIGKSTQYQDRWDYHWNALSIGRHSNQHLQNSFNKYGKNSFSFHIIEFCKEYELDDREKYWIAERKTYNKKFGYNRTHGGDGGILNEESLLKMARSMRGKKHTTESRKKISLNLKGKNLGEKNGMFGKKSWNSGLTAESSEKVRKSVQGLILRTKTNHPQKGISRSEETKLKIGLGNRNKIRSEENKRKISETLKGRKLSEEVRRKMSRARRGIPQRKITCPNCGQIGSVSVLKRWHFNNCRKVGL